MSLPHRALLSLGLLGVALLAGGCYQSTAADPDAGPSTGPAADAGGDDASAAPEDGGATADAGPCMPDPNDPSPRALMVFADGPNLLSVDSRGQSRTLFTFGAAEGLAADKVSVNEVLVRGGFVAASAFLVMGEQSNPEDVVLLEVASGRVVYHRYVSHDAHPELFLDARGTVAVNTWDGNGVVAGPSGAANTLTGMSPVAAVAPWGELPVRRGSPRDSIDLGWLDPATGAFRPLAHAFDPDAATQYVRPAWAAGRLLYFTREGAAVSLVSEGANGDARVVPLDPTAAGTLPILVATDDAGWALVVTGTESLARVDVRSGEIAPVRLDGPGGGQTVLGDWPNGAQVMPDGSVLLAFHTDPLSRLYRTADLGASWVPVGEAVAWTDHTYGRSMSAQWGGGAFAVTTLDLIGYAYELLPVQLVSPDGSPAPVNAAFRNFVPGNRPTALSPDGRCLAYWESTGTDVFGATATLRITDFAGHSVAVHDATDFRDAPTWLR